MTKKENEKAQALAEKILADDDHENFFQDAVRAMVQAGCAFLSEDGKEVNPEELLIVLNDIHMKEKFQALSRDSEARTLFEGIHAPGQTIKAVQEFCVEKLLAA